MNKLAIPFKLNNKLNDKVSEFNVHFDKNKNSFEKFLEFAHTFSDKRINVAFSGSFPMGLVDSINKVADNVYVRLINENFSYWNQLQKKGYKFFFDASYPVFNLSSLDELISMGITDIYPVDDLLYNLKDTKEYSAAHDVNLRLVLNAIPATTINRGKTYKSQIYRPQDRKFLDDYFDTYEFACGNPYDWAQCDVLYRAWFEREGWNGDLAEINGDLKLEFPNLSIPLDLTEIKSKCGRRCNHRVSNPCDICNQYVTLGKTLKEKEVYLTTNKSRNRAK